MKNTESEKEIMSKKSLDDIIESMKEIGDVLIAHSGHQIIKSNSDEKIEENDLLDSFRTSSVTVDGYDLYLFYQKTDYGSYMVETLQVYNENSPFLPFNLVAKVGQKFLGSHNLCLVEFYKNNRKIYCWSVCVDLSGRPIQYPFKVKQEDCIYEDFKYSYIQPSQVNFF